MEDDDFCVSEFFELIDGQEAEITRVSLDMWGDKSRKQHIKSMAVNKFLKPFRISIMKIIMETLKSAGIDIMVYAGTALSVWRDGGKMIPHDHDIDLAIAEDDFLKVHKTLSGRDDIFISSQCVFGQNKWFNADWSEQVLYNQKGIKRFKVYFTDEYLQEMAQNDNKYRKLMQNYDQTKLFIDIFTLQKKPGTDCYRITWNIPGIYDNDKKCFPRKIIFPMKQYVFEGILVLGPADIRGYLEIEYGYLGRDARYDNVSQLYIKLSDREFAVLPDNIKQYMLS